MELMIGQHAGRIWEALREEGDQSPMALGKTLGLKRDDVDRAIGWLAREGKLSFNPDSRGRVKVSLK